MKYVDAHLHLADAEYKGQAGIMLEDAKSSDVVALVSNATDYATCLENLKLRRDNSALVYIALGIHPWNVNVLTENELEETITFIQSQKGTVRAIGEIGLDYKYETVWEKQMAVFERMLHLAETMDLPVIIHSRGTTDQIVDMLPSYRLKRILLHWFSHPLSALAKAIDNGYFITEGPPATYSQGIREVIANAPLTNLLTETDGPVKYFKKPFSAQLTKPSFIRNVVEAIAEIKKTQTEEVAQQIATNFESFFNIKIS